MGKIQFLWDASEYHRMRSRQLRCATTFYANRGPSIHRGVDLIDRAIVKASREMRGEPTRPAIPEDDPVWQAIMRAPIDDEPETEEERAAMAAGVNGPFIPHAVVMAEVRRRRDREMARGRGGK